MATANANVARHLRRQAQENPFLPALKIPRGRDREGRIDYLTLSFGDLDAEATAWQRKLSRAGVRRGDRTLVMVKPGLPLIAGAFALFRLGAVPVIIDPGMGLRSFRSCVARTRPTALLGIPAALLVSRLFRSAFRSVGVRIAAPSAPTRRVVGLARASGPRDSSPPRDAPDVAEAECPADELAAILFTSGSTGAPKGVCYEHGMFSAQVETIRQVYAIEPGEIDLPMLPIFALFNPALGMTTVVPEIDPRRPAAANPARLVQAIRQENVTNSFGSPTLWRLIANHCQATGTTLPSLRRVLCAGAPVPEALWQAAPRFLPKGGLHSPYGATEALPVSTVSAAERPRSAHGSSLGRPVPGAEVRIIALSDEPIAAWRDARELAPGEIGEIVVSGPMVTRRYDDSDEETRRAKIADPAGRGWWHRMGDCGFQDADGGLWFCGRRAERVRTAQTTLHTEPCEQPFRDHPRLRRCALIGLGPPGEQVPALVGEAEIESRADGARLAAELRDLGRDNPWTAGIRRFYFLSRLPVDVRHNAKIHRLKLGRWAARNRPFMTED